MAQNELGGKIWQKGGKNRLYLKPKFKQNQNVFIEFDDVLQNFENFMSGAVLKVFTNADNKKWAVSQSKMLKHEYMLEISDIIPTYVAPQSWDSVIL